MTNEDLVTQISDLVKHNPRLKSFEVSYYLVEHVGACPRIKIEFFENEDFGTRWNKRMDELEARRGTIEDLKSI